MSYLSPALASLVVLTVGCWLLPACGGEFQSGGGDSGGQAGTAGSAGSAAKGGSGGSAGAVSRGGSAGGGASGCEFDGETYADGDSFPAGDGCNTCSCADGEVSCTLLGCPEEGCVQGDTFYPVGEGTSDGCNSCWCESPGQWACTIACLECTDLENAYAFAIDEARTCDPELTGQCSELIYVGLQCGCESFVNPEQQAAIESAGLAAADYGSLLCGDDVQCGACLAPTSSYCSLEGRCVDVYDSAPGASCKVEGLIYESGSTEVPDPVSCNVCACTDGHLDCESSQDCPEACPPDTAYSSQCAMCGANDGCEVVEHACLPVCNGACQAGACLDGVCKALCG